MSEEDVFEKLQRLIFDEAKLVTYKTLSRLLNIPATKAKLHLCEFFKRCKEKENLSACYLLIGVICDKNAVQCTKAVVVTDDDLEKVKSQFTSLSSEHVFSVQKSKLMDENALYTTDYINADQTENHKYSSITNPHVRVQACKLIKHVANNNVDDKKTPAAVNNQPLNKNLPQKATAIKNKSPDIFSAFQKKSESSKSQKIDAKSSKTDPAPSDDVKTNTGNEGKKPAGSEMKARKTVDKTKPDVRNLFAKQIEKNSKCESKSKVQCAEVSSSVSKMKSTAVDGDRESAETVNSISKIKSTEVTRNSVSGVLSQKRQKDKNTRLTSKRSQKKRSNQSSESDDGLKQKKKRKRILMADDSESESDNEQAKDQTQRVFFMPESPTASCNAENIEEEELIPPTPPIDSGKRKKLKLVSKTFVDEDGYLVTQKSKEYVTDSEDSGSEKQPSKRPPKKELPKIPTLNKKQASLTSFFRQK